MFIVLFHLYIRFMSFLATGFSWFFFSKSAIAWLLYIYAFSTPPSYSISLVQNFHFYATSAHGAINHVTLPSSVEFIDLFSIICSMFQTE